MSELLDGTVLSRYGDYSYYGMNTESGCGLLQGHIGINKKKGLIACFSYYSGAYEISDYRFHRIIRSEKIDDFVFSEKSNDQILMRPDSKLNFISVAASDECLYALYDGKELRHYMTNRGDAPSGSYICIFDWDGNYRRCLHLSCPANCIAWNSVRSRLYLSSMMPDGRYSIGYVKSGAVTECDSSL